MHRHRHENQQYDASQYTVLGHSEASATGIMLLGVIPIGQNNRFVRAQDAAIKAKGGDALINTQCRKSGSGPGIERLHHQDLR